MTRNTSANECAIVMLFSMIDVIHLLSIVFIVLKNLQLHSILMIILNNVGLEKLELLNSRDFCFTDDTTSRGDVNLVDRALSTPK